MYASAFHHHRRSYRRMLWPAEQIATNDSVKGRQEDEVKGMWCNYSDADQADQHDLQCTFGWLPEGLWRIGSD
jgi:hypothetical protein